MKNVTWALLVARLIGAGVLAAAVLQARPTHDGSAAFWGNDGNALA